MYVLREVFDSHVRFLKQHFCLISFVELLQLWRHGGWDASSRYCVLTFDDGWIDTYTEAFSILRKYRASATVFLPTSFIGTSDWFWPEKASWLSNVFAKKDQRNRARILAMLPRTLPWVTVISDDVLCGRTDQLIEYCKDLEHSQIEDFLQQWAANMEVCFPSERVLMNWDEVREMSAAGVSFGSHSVTHKILTKLSGDELAGEVKKSRAMLRDQSINDIPVFCYPNGDWSPDVAECVEKAGYEAATTTQFGYEEREPSQWFGLKRVSVHNDITCSDKLFAFHLAGYNNLSMR
jgi:peptidoglycan/xylan/chitin deacetylase (PgdA/CDA1 family)